jgi:hypothetical protein
MEALKRLLGFHIAPLILSIGVEGWFHVEFQDSYITMDRIKYEGAYGSGKTVEEAAEDYVEKLRGKRLIVHPKCCNEKEFYVL